MKLHLSLLASVVLLASATTASAQTTYQVGPGKPFADLQAVTGRLNPGDVVEVFGKTGAYPGNVNLSRNGTSAAKITIRGVAVGGARPIFSGGTNTIQLNGDHYVLENLDITGGSSRCVFHVAHEVTIRDSVIHHCPQHGLLGADSGSGSLTLERVEVHHSGSGDQKHPIYMATDETAHPGAVFRMRHCYLHDQNGGNNVKTRAQRNEIYYNWIEGGFFRELELIGPDGQNPALAREDSDVVGNVLVKTQGSNAVRIGGDGTGDTGGRYRFVNNTIIMRATSPAIIQVFDRVETLEMHNNVMFNTGSGGVQVINTADAIWTAGSPQISGQNNWIETGSSSIPTQFTGTITGANPGFTNVSTFDVRPTTASALVNAGTSSPTSPAGRAFPSPLFPPAFQPPLHTVVTSATPRPSNGAIDIGAFEQADGGNPQPNQPPVIAITSPAAGTRFTAPASITFAANASDSDGAVTQVEFFRNGTLLGTDTTAPYSLNWTGVAAGSYNLTVRATDDDNAQTTSATVAVTVVNPGNQLPVVSITSPAAGANFTAPASITFAANAIDPDGTVQRVEFFRNGTLLATDTTAPYSLNWNGVAAGSYSLTARATDSANATVTSEPVAITVTVEDPGGQCVSVTDPAAPRNQGFAPQTGNFTVEAQVTPLGSGVDAGFGLSNGAKTAWTGLAAIVLFGADGRIVARNGGAYTTGTVPYTANTTYRVRLVVDMAARRYSAFVRPTGGAEVAIGTNLAFRTEQANVTTLSNVTLISGVGGLRACDVAVTPAAPTTCTTSSGNWQNRAMAAATGTLVIEADATPSASNIDGAFALASGPADAWTDLAAIVIFTLDGTILARNGGLYQALAAVPYAGGQSYHLRLVVNVTGKTYSAFVRPPGGSEIQIAANFAFRSEQSSAQSLATWVAHTDEGSLQICNVTR